MDDEVEITFRIPRKNRDYIVGHGWAPVLMWRQWDHADVVMRNVPKTTTEAMKGRSDTR